MFVLFVCVLPLSLFELRVLSQTLRLFDAEALRALTLLSKVVFFELTRVFALVLLLCLL